MISTHVAAVNNMSPGNPEPHGGVPLAAWFGSYFNGSFVDDARWVNAGKDPTHRQVRTRRNCLARVFQALHD
jgi:hypothetical protein